VLSAFATLWVTGESNAERAVHYGFAAVAVGFALTFVVFLALTVYAATTMPRISFADSYESDTAGD
jgi:hypothetical protein